MAAGVTVSNPRPAGVKARRRGVEVDDR